MRRLPFLIMLLGCGCHSIANAANGTCTSAFGGTALTTYAKHIDEGMDLALMEEGGAITNLNAVGGAGVSLLLCSLLEKNKGAFDFLLRNGADVNLPVKLGYTVVHYAAEADDSYYLKRALEVGGNPNQFNTRQMWKPTPLYFAISADSQENIDLLLEAGAALNEKDTMGETPIVAAVNLNNFRLAYYLARKGADLTVINSQGFSVLEIIRTTAIPEASPMRSWKEKLLEEFGGENP